MLSRVIFFLFGFFLMTIGLTYIIVYTNLLSFGYTLGEYFCYLVTRYECWYFVIGLLIDTFLIFKGEKKYVKRL